MEIAASKIIDLTHSLSATTPCWEGGCGFELAIKLDYKDCSGPDYFRAQRITSRAGIGTHLDAPAHCFPGAKTIDTLELESLIAECVVIRAKQATDETYIVTPEMVSLFEKENGTIRPNTFVIFDTGWSRFWDNPEKFRNDLVFPSVHNETAELLLERGVTGLGIDTLSPDSGGNDFPVHRTILGAGKYLVENIANAGALPPTGAKIFVMPMKIEGGTEAPVRLLALL